MSNIEVLAYNAQEAGSVNECLKCGPTAHPVDPDGICIQCGVGAQSWTISIPKPKWMTANRDYGKAGWKKRLVQDLQWLTAISIRNAGVRPLPTPCHLTWTIHYPKGVGRADAANSYPTTKAILDGIVKAGMLEDDDHKHVVAQTWRRGPNLTCTGRYEITITAEGEGVDRV